MNIVAFFQTGNLRGEICFYQAEPGANVTITVKLKGLDQFYPQSFGWMIATYPTQFVNYPLFPCSDDALGPVYSPVDCPVNTSANCVYGDLGERLGLISSTTTTQTFSDSVLDLYGPNSPIGRSIILRRENENRIPLACANIGYQGLSMTTLRAGYNGLLNGDVIMRRPNGRSGVTLNVDLFSGCNVTGVNPDDLPLIDGSPLRWSLRSGSCNNIGPVSHSACSSRIFFIDCMI